MNEGFGSSVEAAVVGVCLVSNLSYFSLSLSFSLSARQLNM